MKSFLDPSVHDHKGARRVACDKDSAERSLDGNTRKLGNMSLAHCGEDRGAARGCS